MTVIDKFRSGLMVLGTFEGVHKEIEVTSSLATKFGNEYSELSAKTVGFGFIFPEKENGEDDSLDVDLNYKIVSTFSKIVTGTSFPRLISPGRGSSGGEY